MFSGFAGAVESVISEYFIFNNLLYIIDGKNYLVYDGTDIMPVVNYGDKHPVYVPTTYINIIQNTLPS